MNFQKLIFFFSLFQYNSAGTNWAWCFCFGCWVSSSRRHTHIFHRSKKKRKSKRERNLIPFSFTLCLLAHRLPPDLYLLTDRRNITHQHALSNLRVINPCYVRRTNKSHLFSCELWVSSSRWKFLFHPKISVVQRATWNKVTFCKLTVDQLVQNFPPHSRKYLFKQVRVRYSVGFSK
jgi:hypothetical protein